MTLTEFKASLASGSAPDGLSPALKALWADGAGDWEGAHVFVQDDEGGDGAWVHAYLHRKEGDEANARYWYNRADKPFFEGSLEAEWEHIATNLLAPT